MGSTYITLQSNLQEPSTLSSLLSDEKNKGEKSREAQGNPSAFSTGCETASQGRQGLIPGPRVVVDSQTKEEKEKATSYPYQIIKLH